MVQATVQAVEQEAASTEQKKLWGGRFTGATDPLMEKFNESLPFDKRMWREDLKVARAAGSRRQPSLTRSLQYCCGQGHAVATEGTK
jgi:hypothetical protein